MTQLASWGIDPLDIVWRNFFDTNSKYNAVTEKINYPVDIYETETGLRLELAVVGLTKEDLKIQVEGSTLRIIYDKPEEAPKNYIQKGIARRSFDIAWRIASRFDLTKLEARMEKGLLILDIPNDVVKLPKLIEIK